MRTVLSGARKFAACVVIVSCAVQSAAPRADDTPLAFEDPAQEQRYQELLKELRCLVCQNQTLADSHADLAQDLREEIHAQLQQGRSKDEIVDYLVVRYGNFVRYRPTLSAGTLLLWAGPFLLLAAALAILVRLARARRPAPAALGDTDRARLTALLHDRDRH